MPVITVGGGKATKKPTSTKGKRITRTAQEIAGDEAHSPGSDSVVKPPKRQAKGPRISDEQLEGKPKMYMASAQKSTEALPKMPQGSVVTPLANGGGVMIGASIAETVRIAEFANVVIGPVSVQWIHGGLDFTVFEDYDWDGDESFTPAQQRMWLRAYNSARATVGICESVVSEDRETVERSIRQYAQRAEADEKAANASKKSSRARRS